MRAGFPTTSLERRARVLAINDVFTMAIDIYANVIAVDAASIASR
jgi:hypothetical protein